MPSPLGGAELPVPDEIEQSLLGALLLNNRWLEAVADKVAAADFGRAVHGRLFEAIATLVERGVPASPITLKNWFDGDPDLEELGGALYLARLVATTVMPSNAARYAELVREGARRRRLILTAENILAGARHPAVGRTAAQQIEAAENALHAVMEAADGPKIGTAADATQAALSQSEAAYKAGGALAGVTSGLRALDERVGGWQSGDLIYVGGGTGDGKTALATTFALAAARSGVPVAFWSAEMAAPRIGRRLLAATTGISAEKQARGDLAQSDWRDLLAAQREIAELPLYIDDTAAIEVGILRLRARTLKRRHNLGLAVVDYVQLLRAGAASESAQRVPAASAALRDLAKELEIPVVALSQLSREIARRENKRPLISDLRWAGELEQDAAVVLLIYRAETHLARAEPNKGVGEDEMKFDKRHSEWSEALAYARGRAEIIVAKARDGSTGSAHVAFDGPAALFRDEMRGTLL